MQVQKFASLLRTLQPRTPVKPTTRNMATEAKQSEKKALRSRIGSQLSSLSPEHVTSQSKNAQNVITPLPQYQSATRISIYLSMPKAEAQTDILVRDALGSGKAVFVPYIYTVGTEKPNRKVMDMLRLQSVEEYEWLKRDSWGIPKLAAEGREERENAMGGKGLSLKTDGSGEAERSEGDAGGLDVVVVPGVGFDGEMNRLGHGAGFYDSYLTRFVKDGKRRKPFLVGHCLAEQVLPPGQLVVQDWDWKVDAVAVGDGRLMTSKDTQ